MAHVFAVGGCECVVTTRYTQGDAGPYVASGGVITLDGGETCHYCVEGGALQYRQFNTSNTEPTFVLIPE